MPTPTTKNKAAVIFRRHQRLQLSWGWVMAVSAVFALALLLGHRGFLLNSAASTSGAQLRLGGLLGIGGCSSQPRLPGLPRILHQSWKTKQLPDKYQPAVQTFRKHNPNFTFLLWTDEDNAALRRDHYPWFEPAWRRFPHPIYQVDAVRAMYMHRYGGLYFDLDFFCLRPLAPAVANLSGVVLGYMSEDTGMTHSVPNAFMASEPGQPFWLFFLARIMKHAENTQWQAFNASTGRLPHPRPELVTGPVALYYILHEWKEVCKRQGVPHNITIMPRPTWYINNWMRGGWAELDELPERHCCPKHFDLERCAADNPESYTVTTWSHSWESSNAHDHGAMPEIKKDQQKARRRRRRLQEQRPEQGRQRHWGTGGAGELRTRSQQAAGSSNPAAAAL